MSQHPKVVIVTNSLSGGGAERSMNLLANQLFHLDFPVSLIAINSGDRDLVELNCPVFQLNRPYRGSFLRTISSLLKFLLIILKIKPDYVILNCNIPELFGIFIPKYYKIIVVEHYFLPWSTRNFMGLIVRRFLKKKVWLWVRVSDHFKVWKVPNANSIVIENIVSIFNQINSNINHNGLIKRLVFVGRLVDQKNPQLILRVAKQTELPVLIVGAGTLVNELKRFANQNHVEVDFAGFQLNPWRLFLSGDLLILPSIAEGDGLVAIEAIMQAIPIIVNDIPDFRRFNLKESSYAKTEEDYAQRIIVNNSKIEEFKQDAACIQEFVKSRSPEAIGNIWKQILLKRENIYF
jgi:glycosyltransferase involved in cell wall biosynthesis